MMKPIVLSSVVLTLVVGCRGIQDWHDDLEVQMLAHSAYYAADVPLPPGPFARHFERGWKQGYYDVTRGGDPCPPSLPPEPYWRMKYRTGSGPEAIDAWYAGYRQGAAQAEAEGQRWQRTLPLSALCVRDRANACAPCARQDAIQLVHPALAAPAIPGEPPGTEPPPPDRAGEERDVRPELLPPVETERQQLEGRSAGPADP